MIDWYNYPSKKNSFNQETTNRSAKRTLWGTRGFGIKSFSTKDWAEYSDDFVTDIILARGQIAIDMTCLPAAWVTFPLYVKLIIAIDGENNTTSSLGTSNDYWIFMDLNTQETIDGRTIFHFNWPNNQSRGDMSYLPKTSVKGPHVKFKLSLLSTYTTLNTIIPLTESQIFSHFLELYLIH